MYTRLKALIAAPDAGDAWLAQTRGLVENLTAHYRRHIASEDESLQAYAAERLGGAALAEIAQEMRARRK